MNRKGGGNILAGKTGYYIIYIFIFGISMAIAGAFINNNVITEVDFSQLEKDVVGNIMFDCLKGSGFGVIDYSKISDERLNECFDEDVYHVKISLDVDGLDNKEIKNFNFNSDEIGYYVVVEDNERVEKGILSLEFENVA